MINHNSKRLGLIILCLYLIQAGSCTFYPEQTETKDQSLFVKISAEHSGITFQNTINDTVSLPVEADSARANLAWGIDDDYMNRYAGGGVALGRKVTFYFSANATCILPLISHKKEGWY